ncbi:hypothetical protein DFH07DRAFT_746435 [Mycena maculata]|uniref:Uncharacterized protein n=1 Tax=Mycena maculata TaxID=230809 RepID=A0AAD7N8R8_9AGAR|nr:hypothetical protein DFH07DRAFT_746435 [Mycena maculata]
MTLPPDLTSLYRLFLRTSAASVLHQSRATRALRKLWRPTFEDAASVTAGLQNEALSAVNRNDHEIWLQSWHLRMDNTLAMLFTSSKTRGVPHQVTRNLNLLVRGEQERINRRKLPEWKPTLSPDAPEYQAGFQHPSTADHPRKLEEAHAGDALEEVVRMAEGRNHLCFGKIRLTRQHRPRNANLDRALRN